MLDFIGHYNYWIAIALMMVGLYMVIARPNLVKKLVGLNIFQTAVFLLYITMGKVAGGTAPIVKEGLSVYSNPLPSVLILTAIVVAVATTAVVELLTRFRIPKQMPRKNVSSIKLTMSPVAIADRSDCVRSKALRRSSQVRRCSPASSPTTTRSMTAPYAAPRRMQRKIEVFPAQKPNSWRGFSRQALIIG